MIHAFAPEYNKRRKAVVDQYSAYEPLPGQHVNGELTQGENIADIGGVKLAYAALQKALEKHPEIRGVLKQLGGILTVDEMRKLNYAVDGEKRQAKDVVREYLARKGLVR